MSAVISSDGMYRYELRRDIDSPNAVGMFTNSVLFVMLNPSTADAVEDDPTIRRCKGFANDWGYDELIVANLFARRTPTPRALEFMDDPVGPQNDEYLRQLCLECVGAVVFAWGAAPVAEKRAEKFTTWCASRDITGYCLGHTAERKPLHPLYQPKNVIPVDYATGDVRMVLPRELNEVD